MALDWADRRTAAPHRGRVHAGRSGLRTALAVLLLAIAIFAVFAVLALASGLSVQAGSSALANVSMPFTGGTVKNVSATGPGGRPIPVARRGNAIWPLTRLRPGEPVSVRVVVSRPGWIGWLAGATATSNVKLLTPSASVSQPYLTVAAGAPVVVAFDRPVSVVEYGQPGSAQTRVLAPPTSNFRLPSASPAGSIDVAASARTWEQLPASSTVSWFPAGAGPSAVASPRPGSTITPVSALTVTFSQPVANALGGHTPSFSPYTSGTWRQLDAHTLVFHPSGFGFPMASTVRLDLPSGVRVADAPGPAVWTVPAGSPERVRQLLAELGYLPLRFTPSRSFQAASAHAQARAAVDPPAGSFSWRWASTPGALHQLWGAQPATVTRAALMAFENDHALTADGVAGPQTWHALLAAALARQSNANGYTFVNVSEGSESLNLWHDGHVVLSTPVNTGIASAPTAVGTFAVYEHISSGTMSGTNPDGSHYNDPGVPWISYFNGGDALHGFTRAQYGFPQSLGCVEMPVGTAGRVWPYTPIGTLVNVY